MGGTIHHKLADTWPDPSHTRAQIVTAEWSGTPALCCFLLFADVLPTHTNTHPTALLGCYVVSWSDGSMELYGQPSDAPAASARAGTAASSRRRRGLASRGSTSSSRGGAGAGAGAGTGAGAGAVQCLCRASDSRVATAASCVAVVPRSSVATDALTSGLVKQVQRRLVHGNEPPESRNKVLYDSEQQRAARLRRGPSRRSDSPLGDFKRQLSEMELEAESLRRETSHRRRLLRLQRDATQSAGSGAGAGVSSTAALSTSRSLSHLMRHSRSATVGETGGGLGGGSFGHSASTTSLPGPPAARTLAMELAAPHSRVAGAKNRTSLIRGRHARSALERAASSPAGLGSFLVCGGSAGFLDVWCVAGGPSAPAQARSLTYHTTMRAHSAPIVAVVYVPPLPSRYREAPPARDSAVREIGLRPKEPTIDDGHEGLIVSASSDGVIKVFDALHFGLVECIAARPVPAAEATASAEAPPLSAGDGASSGAALTSCIVPPVHPVGVRGVPLAQFEARRLPSPTGTARLVGMHSDSDEEPDAEADRDRHAAAALEDDYLRHSRILVGFDNGVVQCWDLPRGNVPPEVASRPMTVPLGMAHCHTRRVAVIAAAYPSPAPDRLDAPLRDQYEAANAARFITGSLDHSVILWYGPTLTPLRSFGFQDPVTSAQLVNAAELDMLVATHDSVVRVPGFVEPFEEADASTASAVAAGGAWMQHYRPAPMTVPPPDGGEHTFSSPRAAPAPNASTRAASRTPAHQSTAATSATGGRTTAVASPTHALVQPLSSTPVTPRSPSRQARPALSTERSDEAAQRQARPLTSAANSVVLTGADVVAPPTTAVLPGWGQREHVGSVPSTRRLPPAATPKQRLHQRLTIEDPVSIDMQPPGGAVEATNSRPQTVTYSAPLALFSLVMLPPHHHHRHHHHNHLVHSHWSGPAQPPSQPTWVAWMPCRLRSRRHARRKPPQLAQMPKQLPQPKHEWRRCWQRLVWP